jgi:putative ABC transport system permease protein
VRFLFGRRRREDDLEQEIRSHLEMAALERGEPPEEAAAAARREFGNVGLVKDVTREMWSSVVGDTAARDVHYGVRQMIRQPGFAAVAVLTLALGIGGTTAMFSVVNAAILKPLPYPEPERLVWVTESLPHAADESAPGPHFLAWRQRARTLEQIGAYVPTVLTLTGAGEPERLDGVRASAELLPTLGVTPLLGRHIAPAEDHAGEAGVVLLTHALWQRRFAGDPGVLGRPLTLDDRPYTVVGVLPDDFRFFQPAELWVPLALDPEQEGAQHVTNLSAVARLRPGVTREEAQADLEVIRRQYEASMPAGRPVLDGTVRVASLHRVLVGDTARLLLILLGAVGFVLLVACANVANLSLLRAVARQQEIAIRAALGAGRGRLVRQVLTESLLLAACGGVLGLMAAFWLTDILWRLAGPSAAGAIAAVATVHLDLVVLGFTALTALGTGVLFGLGPVLQISRVDLAGSLRSTPVMAGFRPGALRQLLVVFEVALTIVLLAGAGLLIRSFANVLEMDPGYRTDQLLTLRISLPEAHYPTPDRRRAFYGDLLERISSMPGVQSAALTNHLPLTRLSFRGWLTIPGHPDTDGDEPPEHPPTPVTIVSPEYFRTMGIPLRAGSLFIDRHDAGSPRVVILSESLARQLFPNEDPIGRQVWVPGPGKGAPTIIGVVGDVRHEGLDGQIMPQVYVPLRQSPWASMTLVVRSDGDPMLLGPAVRSEVRAVDPHLPIYELQSMEQRLAQSLSSRRMNLMVVGAFAVLALTLAAVGVYGVMAYTVSQRTREIAIRIALGASVSNVLKLVVGQGLALVGAGVAIGLVGAGALTRVLASLLFGVSPTDPVVFIAAAALLIAIALLACYLPARRATPIDPVVVLRCE